MNGCEVVDFRIATNQCCTKRVKKKKGKSVDLGKISVQKQLKRKKLNSQQKQANAPKTDLNQEQRDQSPAD